jgi:hypothetical protein
MTEELTILYLTSPFYYSFDLTFVYRNKTYFFSEINEKGIRDFFAQTQKTGIETVVIFFPRNEVGENAFNTNKFFIPYLETFFTPNNYYLKKTIKKYSETSNLL